MMRIFQSETFQYAFQGDQGGGIGCYVNKVFTLVGVFNVGVRGCEDPPVIFTKVSSLKTWIEDNI